MAWQLRIEIRDAGGEPVRDAQLQASVRVVGSGSLSGPTAPAPSTVDRTLTDDTVGIVVSLAHPRFVPLLVSLVRDPAETSWRWSEPAIRVTTQGRQVTVIAVLSRMRLAPTTQVPEDDLVRRATAAKAPLDMAAREHKPKPLPLPEAVPLGAVPGILATANNVYRRSVPPDLAAYHILAAQPLGDPRRTDWPDSAPAWGASAPPSARPSRAGPDGSTCSSTASSARRRAPPGSWSRSGCRTGSRRSARPASTSSSGSPPTPTCRTTPGSNTRSAAATTRTR